MQAGGERAGRRIFLTLDDARALAAESSMVAVVSPELQRGGVQVKSAYNAGALHGQRHRAAVPGHPHHRHRKRAPVPVQRQRAAASRGDHSAPTRRHNSSATRESIGEIVQLNGIPYTVIGKIRKKDQDSNYSGPDNEKVFVPYSAMAQDFPRLDAPAGVLSQIILAPQALGRGSAARRAGRPHRAARGHQMAARRRGSADPSPDDMASTRDDRDAIALWDTSLQSLMFSRMVQTMKDFFSVVGVVTLALGGLGVMNIMLVAVRERTREIGVRKALGATTAQIQRQFFLEGFLLTMLSGAIGFALALGHLRGGEHCCRCRRVSRE